MQIKHTFMLTAILLLGAGRLHCGVGTWDKIARVSVSHSECWQNSSRLRSELALHIRYYLKERSIDQIHDLRDWLSMSEEANYSGIIAYIQKLDLEQDPAELDMVKALNKGLPKGWEIQASLDGFAGKVVAYIDLTHHSEIDSGQISFVDAYLHPEFGAQTKFGQSYLHKTITDPSARRILGLNPL